MSCIPPRVVRIKRRGEAASTDSANKTSPGSMSLSTASVNRILTRLPIVIFASLQRHRQFDVTR